MKVSDKEVRSLGMAISPFDTQEIRKSYKEGKFARSATTLDLNKRFRWDLYWAAYDRGFRFTTEGLSDSNIDTALRKVIAPL
jgi:hypothetical protein